MVDKDFLPLLKISDSPVLMKFLHECVDDLVGKREANFDNYNSVDIEWTKEDYDKARKGIQNCFSQSVIEDELNLRKQNLDVNVEEAVRNCFLIRRNEIFQAMAKEAVLKNGNNLVENIDWKLKWVLGSSDLASIREPLLQVQLHCCNSIGRNTIDFETNLEQLDGLIKNLSDIKKGLEVINDK